MGSAEQMRLKIRINSILSWAWNMKEKGINQKRIWVCEAKHLNLKLEGRTSDLVYRENIDPEIGICPRSVISGSRRKLGLREIDRRAGKSQVHSIRL